MTLVLIVLIGSFGLFILLTIAPSLFWQQLAFFIGAIALMISIHNIDNVLLWWASKYMYIGSVLFIALSYLGPNIRGATRWIMIAGQQVQPSEIGKPFILFSLAYFIEKWPPREAKYIALHTILFLIPFLLVFKQPDLGTSLIYAATWIAMMIAGGLPLWLFGGGAALFTIMTPVLWHALAAYQKSRIETFLNPGMDPRGAGYNAIQAMIAVGSGQLFGRGLGLGTQSHLQFLPEYHTDFIFASLIEELGFIGGCILFCMYAYLIWRMLFPLVRQEVTKARVYIYTIGLCAMLMTQITINTGMNMGIIPVTGITLPLVSYGGSSLLSLGIAFGLFASIRK